MTTESNNIELPAISAKQAFLNVMANLVETAYSSAEHTDEWRLDETASTEVIRQQLDDYCFAVQNAAYETARILFGQGVDLIALQPTLRALVEEGGWCWPEVDEVTGEVPDPALKVYPLEGNGEQGEWRISADITDRWGELNEHQWARKPLIALFRHEGLLNRLREQMQGESTFVARKDGRFGLLFEVEYECRESETDSAGGAEYAEGLKSREAVVQALREGLREVAKRFPELDFCIPDSEHIYKERPAVWAFMPDGALTESRRRELESDLLAL